MWHVKYKAHSPPPQPILIVKGRGQFPTLAAVSNHILWRVRQALHSRNLFPAGLKTVRVRIVLVAEALAWPSAFSDEARSNG